MANDYTPLRDYLKAQTRADFILTFEEIEDIIDDALPRAAHRATWWDVTHAPEEQRPQREAIMEAGFTATRLADGTRVKFSKVRVRR
ncbi:MAG TPA: hypothetical protein VN130_02060 [Xanthobacteraceae bacterium]|mgnify:CR=1 FL=1|nr:hypothetical protein [Xanthobacteraceae bacterium]